MAKLAELVKKYAAPMYAQTAAGAIEVRRVRASEKITKMRQAVAMTSENTWAGDARWWEQHRDAADAEPPRLTVVRDAA